MPDRAPSLGRIVCAAHQARERLYALTEARALRDAFAPLGEALWWLVIADRILCEHADGYSDHYSSHAGQALRGLRLARNVVAHGDNPTKVLGNEVSFFGRQGFPLRFAPDYLQWMAYEDLPELSKPPSPKVREGYVATLAGKPVLPTIDTAVSHVDAWWRASA